MNYGRRFVTLYRRQGSRPSLWKRNAKNKNMISLIHGIFKNQPNKHLVTENRLVASRNGGGDGGENH